MQLSMLRNAVEFENPEFLMAIPISLVLLAVGLAIFALRVMLRPARTHGSTYPLIGPIKFWFVAVLVLVAVAAAAARPYWVFGGRTFKRGDVDVAIVIDGSASMWVTDLGPSRLELAVREALNLYTEEILTPGDRTALFVFGTTAVRKAHMSSDADRFIEQLGRVAPPVTLSGDAFPWDSDIASAFEHVYQSHRQPGPLRVGRRGVGPGAALGPAGDSSSPTGTSSAPASRCRGSTRRCPSSSGAG